MLGGYAAITNPTNAASILATNSGAFPAWDEVSITEALSISTNYFAYTPHAGLAGCGGLFDSIAETGYPHGPTNEYTANGGSTFPDGRTKWFTTDYGWQPLKEIYSVLKYKRYASPLTTAKVWSESPYTLSSTNSWSEAKSNVESNIVYDGVQATARMKTDGTKTKIIYQPAEWTAFMTFSYFAVRTSTPTNAIQHRVHGYVIAKKEGVFEDFGTGIPEDQWYYIGAGDYETTNASPVSAYAGSTNIISPWCAEPETNSPTANGFTVTNQASVIEYDYQYQ